MSGKRLKSKLNKLEEIKQQIKEEEKRIEQEIGKFVLKTFDKTHEESEYIKNIIEELYLIYAEKNENKNTSVEESSSLHNTNQN